MKKKFVIFDGARYVQNVPGRYYMRSGCVGPQRSFAQVSRYLHRAVWQFYNGAIPAGYDVHHKGKASKATVDITKLDCMPRKVHQQLGHPFTPAEYKKVLIHLVTIRESQKCEQTCSRCNVLFKARAVFAARGMESGNRFCSRACKAAWRREQLLDGEVRVCALCGTGFVCDKYCPSDRRCSRACAYAHKRLERA
jgi:hypothetical protein